MELWILVAWMAIYPTERVTLGTFTTQDECESRVEWLWVNRKHKRDQRLYECLAVTNPECPVSDTPPAP